MKETKLKNLLGLAQRARLLVSGTFKVEESLKNGKVKLIVVTTDTSESTIKDYKQAAEFKKIPIIIALTKESLGHALGKEYRSVAAVLDEGFSKSMCKLIDSEN